MSSPLSRDPFGTSPSPRKRRRPASKGALFYDSFSVIFMLLFFIVALMHYGIEGAGTDKFNLLRFMGAELLAFAGVLFICADRKAGPPRQLYACRFAWALALGTVALFVIHCALFRSLKAALRSAPLLYLCQSRLWTDQLLAATLFLFCLISVIFTLISRHTRKAVLRMLIPYIPMISIAGPALEQVRNTDRPLGLLLGSLLLLSWPMWAGYHALTFERRYGAQLKTRPASSQNIGLKTGQASTPVRPNPPTAPSVRPIRSPAPAAVKSNEGSSKPASGPQASSVDERALKLAREKADYEKRALASAERDRSDPSRSLLPEVARRLFPAGAILATLGGQRQLLIWLVEGVPCLAPLMRDESAQALMRPELPDDPERFVPLLETLSKKAAAILEEHLYDDAPQWQSLTPEALARGWFSLRMYARMSQSSDLFELSALEVSRRISQREDALEWLQNNA